MSQQYFDLNQQYNATAEHLRAAGRTNQDLEKAYRQLKKDLNRAQQVRQNLQHFLNHERDRLNLVLDTTGTLARALCLFSAGTPPGYPDDHKRNLKQECEALEASLVKQREMLSLQGYQVTEERVPW